MVQTFPPENHFKRLSQTSITSRPRVFFCPHVFISPYSDRRSLLATCSKAIAEAKTASPEIFTPLHLQCFLKHRDGGGSGGVLDEVAGATSGYGRSSGSPTRQHGQHTGHEAAPHNRQQYARETLLRATLSLRGEMIVPAVGIRLTPIASPALLHTALYQSLLTRGAEDKMQSG